MINSKLLIIGIVILSGILIWIVYDNIMTSEGTEYFINPPNINNFESNFKINKNSTIKPNVYKPIITENFKDMVDSHKNNLHDLKSNLKETNLLNYKSNHKNLEVKMNSSGEIISTKQNPSIYLN
jgi:hypothetical protein